MKKFEAKDYLLIIGFLLSLVFTSPFYIEMSTDINLLQDNCIALWYAIVCGCIAILCFYLWARSNK